jgi:hypothetical protein
MIRCDLAPPIPLMFSVDLELVALFNHLVWAMDLGNVNIGRFKDVGILTQDLNHTHKKVKNIYLT